jgi:hypothetical protein
MQWSLKRFLIFVPVMALILVFLIQNLFTPISEGPFAILGPITTGANFELPPPDENLILRVIERNDMVAGKGPNLLSPSVVEIEEIESWFDEEKHHPLIGPAKIHHRVWRCELETTMVDGSVSRRSILLDQNHFHMDGSVTGNSNF